MVSGLFTRDQAADWCRSNDFLTNTYRTREDDDGNLTHHIFAQFDPPDDAEWVTIADDFPDGVSASCVVTEDKSMNPVIKTGTQSESDPFTFIMSTEDKDRDGDVIRAKGWNLKDFKRNPVALFGHSHTQPIGTWENVRVEGKKLLGDLKLAAKGTSEFIDTLHKLIEQRILRAVSVGSAPMSTTFCQTSRASTSSRRRFTNARWYQYRRMPMRCASRQPNSYQTTSKRSFWATPKARRVVVHAPKFSPKAPARRSPRPMGRHLKPHHRQKEPNR